MKLGKGVHEFPALDEASESNTVCVLWHDSFNLNRKKCETVVQSYGV